MYQRRGEEIRLQDLTRVTATYRFPNPRTGLLGSRQLFTLHTCVRVYNKYQRTLLTIRDLLAPSAHVRHTRTCSASHLSTPVGFAVKPV